MMCRAQCVQEMYSASQDDRAIMACCLELQESGPPPHSTIKPETDFRESHDAQSESAKERRIGGLGSELL